MLERRAQRRNRHVRAVRRDREERTISRVPDLGEVDMVGAVGSAPVHSPSEIGLPYGVGRIILARTPSTGVIVATLRICAHVNPVRARVYRDSIESNTLVVIRTSAMIVVHFRSGITGSMISIVPITIYVKMRPLPHRLGKYPCDRSGFPIPDITVIGKQK